MAKKSKIMVSKPSLTFFFTSFFFFFTIFTIAKSSLGKWMKVSCRCTIMFRKFSFQLKITSDAKNDFLSRKNQVPIIFTQQPNQLLKYNWECPVMHNKVSTFCFIWIIKTVKELGGGGTNSWSHILYTIYCTIIQETIIYIVKWWWIATILKIYGHFLFMGVRSIPWDHALHNIWCAVTQRTINI